jgi:hypothetical protein
MASQYPLTQLTMHEFLPDHFAAAVALLSQGERCGAGSIGQPAGAWQSTMGAIELQWLQERRSTVSPASGVLVTLSRNSIYDSERGHAQ